ncbi:helix-turn-helix domain-containing protein [Streptomyces sp. NPDC052236]|uniref:helix-turn-helix domain-containing protein n=1 Tax=Streptomyces sp. NPDC052236 TaxID=3365686 RepID=UPI0037D28ADC
MVDYAHQLAKGVRERRRELGISQSELARRAGMTQPGISRIELGGTTPTLPLLSRLAGAMDSELDIHLAPEHGQVIVRFTSHGTEDAA